MNTGYVWHELFGWVDTGTGGLGPADPRAGLQPVNHVAHPDTKRRLHELVAVSGLIEHLERVTPRHASAEELLRVHAEEHLARLERESAQPKGGDAGDGFSPFGQGGYDIARLAAGGAVELVDAVISGRVDNGYALVNPPGHHALGPTGMGFCLLNNVAVAVAHARAARGVERVAVIDWDVHHGNGTQAIFWDTPEVLTVSVHQDGCFPPDSGHLSERGGDAAPGSAINIPLPLGTGDFGYQYAFEQVVLPSVRTFRPDLIVVASGFDANGMDPLARQLVSSRGFRIMTEQVLELASEVCAGRVAMVQEGGYSPQYVPFCGLAVLQAMTGVWLVEDAYFPIVGNQTGHDLATHQKAVVDEVASIVL